MRVLMAIGVIVIVIALIIQPDNGPADECSYVASAPQDATPVATANVTIEGVVTSSSEGVTASGHVLASESIAFHLKFRKDGEVLLVSNSGGATAGFTGQTGQFCALAPGKVTFFPGAKAGFSFYHLP